MILLFLLLVTSVAVGYAGGGRLRNLATVDLAAPWLALAAATTPFLSRIVHRYELALDVTEPILLAGNYLLLGGFLWANRRLVGVWLIALGVAGNALVIYTNGTMPVAEWALRRAGFQGPIDAGRHHVLETDSPFATLADIIPVLRHVISVGDVLMGLGAAMLIVAAMRGRARFDRPQVGGTPPDLPPKSTTHASTDGPDEPR